jgi:hypothetical protein
VDLCAEIGDGVVLGAVGFDIVHEGGDLLLLGLDLDDSE